MSIPSLNSSVGYVHSPCNPLQCKNKIEDDYFEPIMDQQEFGGIQEQNQNEETPIKLIQYVSQISIEDNDKMMQVELLGQIDDQQNVQRPTRRKQSKANYNIDNSPSLDGDAKPCHCSKTHCLQLYCSCFHNRRHCIEECGCQDCYNDGKHEHEVQKAVEQIKIKEQRASHHDLDSFDTRQVWGCKCKKTKCIKGYCECYIRGKKCTSHCHCSDCQNKRKYQQQKKIRKI